MSATLLPSHHAHHASSATPATPPPSHHHHTSSATPDLLPHVLIIIITYLHHTLSLHPPIPCSSSCFTPTPCLLLLLPQLLLHGFTIIILVIVLTLPFYISPSKIKTLYHPPSFSSIIFGSSTPSHHSPRHFRFQYIPSETSKPLKETRPPTLQSLHHPSTTTATTDGRSALPSLRESLLLCLPSVSHYCSALPLLPASFFLFLLPSFSPSGFGPLSPTRSFSLFFFFSFLFLSFPLFPPVTFL